MTFEEFKSLFFSFYRKKKRKRFLERIFYCTIFIEIKIVLSALNLSKTFIILLGKQNKEKFLCLRNEIKGF